MYLGHCKLEKCEEDQFFFLAEKWVVELAHQPNLKYGKLNKSSKAENKLVQSNELGSNQSKKIKTKKKRIIHKKCNTCNSIVLDIKSHMKDVHNKLRPPLSCSSKDCKHIVKSGRKTDLKKHQESHSCGANQIICGKCGRHVSSKQALEGHMRRRDCKSQFKCEMCPESFRLQDAKSRHMLKEHFS